MKARDEITTVERRRRRQLTIPLVLMLPLVTGCLGPKSEGERLYRRHCASCHGTDGGGGVRYLADEGANLLDESWKYGSGYPSDLESSLQNEDVTEHTTWELTRQERRQIVDHILLLRGERR